MLCCSHDMGDAALRDDAHSCTMQCCKPKYISGSPCTICNKLLVQRNEALRIFSKSGVLIDVIFLIQPLLSLSLELG